MAPQKIISYIIPNLLIIPIILRWLLPVSIEDKFFLCIDGVYFFLPDLLYLMYIFLYKGNRDLIRNRKAVLFLICIFSFFVLFHLSLSEGEFKYKLNVVINSFSFIYIPFIYVNWPLDSDGLNKIKYLLVASLLLLCGEVLLFSIGILAYTTADGNNLTEGLTETSGIMRISTTVGAATGTAVLILMLSFIITGYYKWGKVTYYGFLVLISITILFTVSRGSLLVWTIYVLFLEMKKILTFSYRKKIQYFILFSLTLLLSYQQGVFDPLQYRIEENADDQTTGRSELNNEAMHLIRETDYMGVGIGNVFPEKIIQYEMDVPHYIGMHNTYLTYIAEIGIIGFFLLFLFYFSILSQLYYSKYPMAIALLCLLIISFNTEAIVINQEFIAAFFLLIISIFNLQYKDNEDSMYVNTN